MQHNITERLNEHSLPVDASYWAEMEERLQRRSRKTRSILLWFSSTGIAASFALLLVFNFVGKNNNSTQITQIKSVEAFGVEQISTDKTTLQSSQNEIVKTEPSTSQKLDLKIPTSKRYYPTISVQEQAYTTFDRLEKTNDTDIETITEIPNVVQTENDTISENQEVALFKYNNEIVTNNSFTLNKEKITDNNSWLIATVVSASNSNSSNKTPNYYFENKPNGDKAIAAPDVNQNLPAIDDIFRQFPEVTHAPLLSMGLMVRKKLNKHLALETGVNYTFLQSKFKDNANEWQQRSATLKLHYIGLPLNVVTYVLNKPNWNVYVSVGGMVEKGLRIDYKQTTVTQQWYGGNKIFNNQSLQDNIQGVQWSLNTALGIDYTIYRNIGLYFEPRIIYYFKNNQPASVRTETPLSVGLNAGIRLEF